jgi:probable DNA metabolism protein
MSITVFVCEDSLDGILTGVYDAWDSHLGHENVKLETEAEENLELFCVYRSVETDTEKAEKVLGTVLRRMGEEAREAICYASAVRDAGKADAIYRMIVLGLHLKDGRRAVHCLQNVSVSLVMRLRQRAWHEVHRLLGFLRFEELGNGVLYARMDSPCAALSLIAPHFADRLRQEDWIIHDIRRGEMAVHRREYFWVLTDDRQLNPEYFSCLSEREEEFRELWRSFCKSIAIEERRNPDCQQSLLPLRFRPCMTEFQK